MLHKATWETAAVPYMIKTNNESDTSKYKNHNKKNRFKNLSKMFPWNSSGASWKA